MLTTPERFIFSHPFLGESAEGKGGAESVFKKLRSNALTLPIKNVNTSFKPHLVVSSPLAAKGGFEIATR